MIPNRKLSKDLKFLMELLLVNPKSFSYDEFISALIVATLELNNGNRIHTANQLKMNIKTLREKLKMIEGLGYDVPKPQWGRRKNIE
jgi:DNA-binding NtrC family response regulator